MAHQTPLKRIGVKSKEVKKQPKQVIRGHKPEEACLGHGSKKCTNFCKRGTCLRLKTLCAVKYPPEKKAEIEAPQTKVTANTPQKATVVLVQKHATAVA